MERAFSWPGGVSETLRPEVSDRKPDISKSVSPTPDPSEDATTFSYLEEIQEYLPRISISDDPKVLTFLSGKDNYRSYDSPPSTPQGYEADEESQDTCPKINCLVIPNAPKKQKLKSRKPSRYVNRGSKKVARMLFPHPRKVWGKKFNKKINTTSVTKRHSSFKHNIK